MQKRKKRVILSPAANKSGKMSIENYSSRLVIMEVTGDHEKSYISTLGRMRACMKPTK